jgi:hypothetical protein
VEGTEAHQRSHLLKGPGGVQVLLDVLEHGSEPPARQRAVAAALGLAGGQDVTERVDGQDVGRRLRSQPYPGTAGG